MSNTDIILTILNLGDVLIANSGKFSQRLDRQTRLHFFFGRVMRLSRSRSFISILPFLYSHPPTCGIFTIPLRGRFHNLIDNHFTIHPYQVWHYSANVANPLALHAKAVNKRRIVGQSAFGEEDIISIKYLYHTCRTYMQYYCQPDSILFFSCSEPSTKKANSGSVRFTSFSIFIARHADSANFMIYNIVTKIRQYNHTPILHLSLIIGSTPLMEQYIHIIVNFQSKFRFLALSEWTCRIADNSMKSSRVISVENQTVLPDNEDERDKWNFLPNISTSMPSGFSAITFLLFQLRNLKFVPTLANMRCGFRTVNVLWIG